MHIARYDNPAVWLDEVGPLLYRAEAENNLPLGLALHAVEFPDSFPEGLLLLSAHAPGRTVGAALATPPHNLVLSRQPLEGLDAIAEFLARTSVALPGVIGPDDVAGAFAQSWSRRTGVQPALRMQQRIHECANVVLAERTSGVFRPAAEPDVPLLSEWQTAFSAEVGADAADHDPAALIRRRIEREHLFVWEREGEVVVSCAGLSRQTAHGISVNLVYTPPEQRGRGYATSCVAELTDRALRAGRRFCCLYTDLANPTANAIYRRIGYRPVCDSQWWAWPEPPTA